LNPPQKIEAENGQIEFNFLVKTSESADTFQTSFTEKTGQQFTPKNFRDYRLDLLKRADVFINIRVAMSESSAFEMSYHVYQNPKCQYYFGF